MSQEKYEELIAENEKLKQEVNKLQIEVENQQLQINMLNRYLFGSKREKTEKEENIVEGTQCSIFGEVEDKEVQEQVEEKTEEIIVHRKKNAKKTKAGIKKSELKNVEIETREYKLEEDKQKCTECEGNLKQIGKEVVRQTIEYVPAKLKIVNYVRYVYKCEECGTEGNKKDTATIIKTKVPQAMLAHSFVTPSLATEVIYQKYYMGVPLYRQEKIWDDRGLILPRNMMANWCIKLSEYYLSPIYETMLNQMKRENKLLHVDETTVQCNKEKGRKPNSKSYMWVVASGELEEKKGVIFYYSKSRSAEIANKLLEKYERILVTDGYAGYNILEDKLTHAECWAHARRYFYDSVPLDDNKQMIKTSDGYKGVEYIDELFKIEKEIKDLNETDKLKERRKKSAPIVEKFYEWVNLTMQKYITNKKLKKALLYVTNQKKSLVKFLEDGRIPLTNSRVERAIRPFAVHRKNWLFADSVKGAKANAIMYSIIETAKTNKLNINKYIRYLLEELPQLEGEQTEKAIEKYLPWSKELPKEIRNYEGEYKDMQLV